MFPLDDVIMDVRRTVKSNGIFQIEISVIILLLTFQCVQSSTARRAGMMGYAETVTEDSLL